MIINYDPDQSYGFMVYATSRNMYNYFSSILKSYDLTPEQWNVISHLGEDEGSNQKNLSEKTNKDQASITRILAILEKKELVERRRNPEDKREQFIYLTDKGVRLRKQIIPVEVRAIERMIEGISNEQLAQLREVLRLLNQNIILYDE